MRLPRATLAMVLACAALPVSTPAPAEGPPAAPRSGGDAAAVRMAAPRPSSQPSPPWAIETEPREGLPAVAAALMMSGQEGGSILVSLLAAPLTTNEAGTQLGIVIDIEGSSLLAGQSEGPLPVEVSAYAVSAQGSVSRSFTQVFTLDAARAAEALGKGGIKVTGTLRVPPGPQTVRVLVRDLETSAFGLEQVELSGLPAKSDQPFVSAAIFPEPASAWLLARERTRGGGLAPYPFVFSGTPLLPSTRPVLPDEAPASAWIVARGLPAGALVARVRDLAGEEMGEVPVQADPGADEEAEGISLRHLSFTLPRLYPGRYTVAFALAGAADAPPLTPALEFVVPDPSLRDKPRSWAQLGPAASPAGVPAARATVARTRKKPPSRELEKAYLAAIAKLTGARPAEAQAAVMDVEGRAAAVGTTDAMTELVAAEVEVAQRLARAHPESTLGLYLLHAELFRTYGERRQYLLQSYTRRTLEELIRLAVRGKSDEAFRTLAADAVAVMGAEFQHANLPKAAERFYRRALELQPGNGAALMGLAAGYERTGHYRQALERLEEMVRAHPDDTEARLRLAVNLERESTQRRAREAFERCLKPDNPTWVRAVAYQELAQMLIEGARFEEARTLLADATRALPHNQRLSLQLAYVLDRLGEPLAARKVADGIAARGESDEESPRMRYSDWPRDAFAAARARLSQGSAAVREALKQTLADAASGSPS